MTTPDLHVVPRNERPTLPPDVAECARDSTLCPGLEQIVIDLGVLRAQVERIAANQAMLIASQRDTNTMLATILARLP